jgi:sugar O-acyltransferase (sialic acid O-acetyltransferase NeuD family)
VTDRQLYVAGTRTFAAEIAGYAEESGFRVVGLLEPYDRERVGQTIHGLPVTWLEETEPRGLPAVVGTGEPARREIVDRLLASGWKPATIIHPRAHVAAGSTVGAGAVVAPGVVVGACSAIGDFVVLGRGSLVGHHTEIGPFATLGPGVNVAGNVRIEADAFVGMAAVIRDHVTVGAASFVAMGAVVLGDVAPGVEVKGFPARPSRTAE